MKPGKPSGGSSGGTSVTDYGPPDVDFDQIDGLLSEDPDNPDLLDIAAFAHYCAGHLMRAQILYERLIALNPDVPSHHFYLANTYFRVSLIEQARQEWRRTVALDEDGKFGEKARERLEGLPQPRS